MRLLYALSVALLFAAAPALAASEPLGQETVEARQPRNPKAKPRQAHDHRHRHHTSRHTHRDASDRRHPHSHRHRHGRRDAHTGHFRAHRQGAHGDAGHARGARAHAHGNGQPQQNGIETENLFGFTLGSDTEEAGEKGIALETVGRFGKRDGRYTGISKKLEFNTALTDDLSVSLGLLSNYHRVVGVTGLDDVRGFNFNGVGAEARWRLARRGTNAFGLTLHIEPSAHLYDELTGIRATKYGAENKLILDTEVVKDRVFAAFNLIYELERVREQGSPEWENSSKLGIAAAATLQVFPKTFVGAEVRYLRAYEGLMPQTFRGEALYVGPTLFWHFAPKAWIAAAWNVQVAGHEAGNPARLDLTNFERHQARLKIGVEFEPMQASQARR